MAVETGQAIITAIYNRLTADTALKAAMGGSVRLYRVMAPADPDMPYLVHRMESAAYDHSQSTYWLDLWHYGADSATVDTIIERIRVLLENWRITTGDSEIGAGRMLFNPKGSGFVPSDNNLVWHYSTMWTIHYMSKRLIGLVS